MRGADPDPVTCGGAGHVLKCRVTEAQWHRWQQHLVPPRQPFYVSEELACQLPSWPRWNRTEFREMRLPLTFTDTFRDYAVSDDAPWVVLPTEEMVGQLTPDLEACLLNEQQRFGRGLVNVREEWEARLPELSGLLEASAPSGLFLWWPGVWQRLSEAGRQEVLLDFITADRLPHRGDELSADHWEQIDRTLPGVRALAGTFADDSGANCLGATLAAFGVPSVADLWLHVAPFERWLLPQAREGAELDELGTVLVWRDERGQLQHAAVALGEGWLFHKESQNWWSPRQVVRLSNALARWDTAGWTLQAFQMRQP